MGNALASRLAGATDDSALIQSVTECRVQGASSKGKRVLKGKLIDRRSPDESQFLSELVLFIARSGCGTT